MISVRLAIQREDLVRSLVLVDTTADAEPDDVALVYRGFQEQIAANDGIPDELAEGTLPIFYGPTFMEANPETLKFHVERERDMPTTALVQGLEALLGRDSVVDRLGEIRVPTLVIHGEVDQALPIAKGEELADGIPGAELLRVPDAGHSTPLEAPDVVNEALAGFFARVKR
jgi:pimeloyl-ACP methyl ester carboxylesterase